MTVLPVTVLPGRVVPAVLAALACAACSPNIHTAVHDTRSGFASDQSTVQVISTNVGGKNVYIPGTIVVTGGTSHTLSIFNTTDTPHGFSIAGLGIQVVLPPQEEVEVVLPPLEGGHVFRVHCHLHPPHRSATLVVLPER